MDFVSVPLVNKHFSDLNPIDCGREACRPGHSFGPNIRQYYLMHYVTSGCGTLYKDSRSYSVGPGQSFLILPGEITTYTADLKTPWDYIWIGFNGSLAERFKSLENPVITKNLRIFTELTNAFSFTTAREEFLASKLFNIYSLIFDSENDDHLIRRAENLILTNYMKPVKIEEIATTLNINRRYLSRIMKQETGLSLKELLTKTRMERANELLSEGFLCYEAAAMVGYSDPLMFSKAYFRYYGCYPTKQVTDI